MRNGGTWRTGAATRHRDRGWVKRQGQEERNAGRLAGEAGPSCSCSGPAALGGPAPPSFLLLLCLRLPYPLSHSFSEGAPGAGDAESRRGTAGGRRGGIDEPCTLCTFSGRSPESQGHSCHARAAEGREGSAPVLLVRGGGWGRVVGAQNKSGNSSGLSLPPSAPSWVRLACGSAFVPACPEA